MAPFDPYRKWLGIPPEEQPPNYYRLLGVGLFETDPDVIAGAADRQMVHVRSFQAGPYSELSQRILNELAAARLCLLDAQKKAAYDQQLRRQAAPMASPVQAVAVPPPAVPVGMAPQVPHLQAHVDMAPQIPPPPPPPGSIQFPPAAGSVPPPPAGSLPPPPGQQSVVIQRAGNGRSAYANGRRRRSVWQGAGSAILVIVLVALGAAIWAIHAASQPHGQSPSATPGGGGAGTATDPMPTAVADDRSAAAGGTGRRNRTGGSSGTGFAPSHTRPSQPIGAGLDAPVGEIRSFSGHQGPVAQAVLARAGTQILSGGEDGTVRLWDAHGGDEILRLQPDPAASRTATLPVLSVALSSDGQYAMASRGATGARGGGVVDVWRLGAGATRDGRPMASIELGDAEIAWFCGFSPASDRILLACEDATLRLLAANSHEALFRLAGHGGAVRAAAFSEDGSKVLSGSDDRALRLWNAADGQPLLAEPMLGHGGAVLSVSLSPDGRHAVSGGADGVVWVWNIQSGQRLRGWPKHDGPVPAIACAPDGLRAVSGGADGSIRVWLLADGAQQHHFPVAHVGGVRSIALSANGRRAVSAGADGLVKLWAMPPAPSPTFDPSEPSGPVIAGVDPPADVLPRPDEAAVQAAATRVRDELFAAQFAATVEPAQRLELAQTLIHEGQRPQADPALPWALFDQARQLAIESGDVGLAVSAAEATASRYRLDAAAMKLETLEAMSAATLDAQVRRLLNARVLGVADEALVTENFDTAERAVALARTSAANLRDATMTRDARAKEDQIARRRQRYEAVAKAMEVLKQQADDAEANLAVGQYECFIKGDWAQGLPKLARAADESLRALAARDLANPTTAAEQVAVANAWWDLAAGRPEEEQAELKRRAASWYRQITPDQAGVDSATIQQRLAEAAGLDAPAESAGLPPVVGYEGRTGAAKVALLRHFGGDESSEAAVGRALGWLAAQQRPDGSWNFDHAAGRAEGVAPDTGTLDKAPNAATAMVLLPFLAFGQSPREGEFHRNVTAGVDYLKRRMVPLPGEAATLYEPDGDVMPSHALGTIALSETFEAMRDRTSRTTAMAAVRFITATQNADGGWGTKPPLPTITPDPSNMHSTGWNLLALKSAQWAGLQVPDATLKRVEAFLDTMVADDGQNYRRAANLSATDTYSTTMGYLCRVYLGWPRERKELADHVATLEATGPSPGKLYLNFLNTQTARDVGGPAWERWNGAMRGHLLTNQSTTGPGAGSWYADSGDWGNRSGGRLFCTAMAALSLQVYYRNPPALP